MALYIVMMLFIACFLFVAVEDFALRKSTLKNRWRNAIFVYVHNPIYFIFFLVKAFFLFSDGRLAAIGVQFLYLPCVVFIGKLCVDLCMRNETVRQWYTMYVSDNEHIQKYWTSHLGGITWALRLFYGVVFVYAGFHFYALLESVDAQPFERSQEIDFRLSELWFSLQAFFTVMMCQLTAEVMVIHMLPDVQGAKTQTYRSCVTSAGTIVLVCVGGGLIACDAPAFWSTQPNDIRDTFRSVRGLPLVESAAGLYMFQNIHFLVHKGDIDYALITDPETGRLSDERMVFHLKTTYKQLVMDKCSADFASKYASPESFITKACYQMSGDFVNWVKKKSPFNKK